MLWVLIRRPLRGAYNVYSQYILSIEELKKIIPELSPNTAP